MQFCDFFIDYIFLVSAAHFDRLYTRISCSSSTLWFLSTTYFLLRQKLCDFLSNVYFLFHQQLWDFYRLYSVFKVLTATLWFFIDYIFLVSSSTLWFFIDYKSLVKVPDYTKQNIFFKYTLRHTLVMKTLCKKPNLILYKLCVANHQHNLRIVYE